MLNKSVTCTFRLVSDVLQLYSHLFYRLENDAAGAENFFFLICSDSNSETYTLHFFLLAIVRMVHYSSREDPAIQPS
jgi:hypothetical protein